MKKRIHRGLIGEDFSGKAQRAEHPDYEPDLNFKKGKADQHDDQRKLF